MPVVQFRNEVSRINITKNMAVPKKVTDLKAWFKSCRSVIPDIPNVMDEEGLWMFACDPDVTVEWIRWDIQHKFTGERCYLVVNRAQRMPTF